MEIAVGGLLVSVVPTGTNGQCAVRIHRGDTNTYVHTASYHSPEAAQGDILEAARTSGEDYDDLFDTVISLWPSPGNGGSHAPELIGEPDR